MQNVLRELKIQEPETHHLLVLFQVHHERKNTTGEFVALDFHKVQRAREVGVRIPYGRHCNDWHSVGTS